MIGSFQNQLVEEEHELDFQKVNSINVLIQSINTNIKILKIETTRKHLDI